MVAGSRLIVLNEISTLINEAELGKLHAILRHYAAEGISFLYICFHFEELLRISDRTALMMHGRVVKLLEGSDIEVPVGANSKNAMVPLTTVNTRNILFICGGAFPDLENIIKERLNKNSSVGFQADLKDKYDKDKNLLSKVTVEDLRNFGMIPEFLGRLPVICTLEGLTEDMLVKILQEPKNAILKQYKKLLALDEVKLDFDEGALRAIARLALEKDTGARALRAILEEFMLDIMYEIPKDDSIGQVVITKEYIEHTGGPRIMLRGQEPLRLEAN